MPTPIPIRHSDGSPLGHVTIHLSPEAAPGDLIANIRDGEVVEYVHLPRRPALPGLVECVHRARPATAELNNADCIRGGLDILARYGKVDCAAEHDEFYAGVDTALSPADLDAILALGWRSNPDGGPGSFEIFV